MRRGRLSNSERAAILDKIGEEAERIFKNKLRESSWHMDRWMDSFYWEPDITTFENAYWIESGSEKWNRIYNYLEYGTGLYGPKATPIKSDKISEKTGKRLLLKICARKPPPWTFVSEVSGVKPGFFFTSTIEYMKANKKYYVARFRNKLGI
jgi:hypothetical protein